MRDLIRHILAALGRGETLVRATVCEHSGSTPRSSGAGMALMRDGSSVGTVGGGMAEAMAQRKGAELLKDKHGPEAVIMRMNLSNDQAAALGMLCGGDMAVLLERISPTPADKAFFTALDRSLRNGKNVVMATDMGPVGGGDEIAEVHRSLLGAGGQDLPGEAAEVLAGAGSPGLVEAEGRRYFVEPVGARDAVYIIGAGHVAAQVAKLTATVGFRTVVMDDRPEFANAERFPDSDQVVVLEDFLDPFAGRAVGANDSVVIVTRGHLHDKVVLARSLDTPAGYVGMIGSRRKRDAIYEALGKEGVSKEQIERVHCPIGLAIGAETPEEIAVSIVAELIQARAQRRGNGD